MVIMKINVYILFFHCRLKRRKIKEIKRSDKLTEKNTPPAALSKSIFDNIPKNNTGRLTKESRIGLIQFSTGYKSIFLSVMYKLLNCLQFVSRQFSQRTAKGLKKTHPKP